jgi:hypothetical protein
MSGLHRFVRVVGVAVVVAGVGAAAALAHDPDAITRPATEVGSRSAVLQGIVNPEGKSTTYRFEYGTTTAYGTFTPAASAGKDKAQVLVSYALAGLAPSTTYHVRLVAGSTEGVTRGGDVAFTTSAEATVPGTQSPEATSPTSDPGASGGTAPPVPVLGEKVNLAPALGTVLVRAPGAATAVPLEHASSIAVGALVDTRKGAVDLTSALPGGATQSATVHGGVFQVRQPASGRGMTELVLRGPKPACGSARAAASSRRPPRTLWTSDHHGRFRTRGSNAVATVRGTSWFMADRCDGTYTRVKHGSVKVRDLRTGRTLVLRAGQSHLSPAAR